MSGAVLLALLVCGHVLADFVVQTRAMVERKKTSRAALRRHAAWASATHLALLLPVLSPALLLVVPALGMAHYLVDAAKIACEKRYGEGLRWFFLDQGVHLVVLVAVAVAWSRSSVPWVAPGQWLVPIYSGAVLVTLFSFNGNGGSAIVRGVLARFPLTEGQRDALPPPAMGHLIGVLERALAVTLVLLEAWGGLGLILAGKSLARFKDLEHRPFGEYYLIGTLTSMLVALLTGIGARAALNFVP